MDIEIDHRGDICVVQIVGDMDHYSAEEFKGSVTEQVAGGYKKILIKLSRCPYIDSSGIGSLISMHEKYKKDSVELKLTGITGELQSILRRAGILTYLGNYDSEQSAIESFL